MINSNLAPEEKLQMISTGACPRLNIVMPGNRADRKQQRTPFSIQPRSAFRREIPQNVLFSYLLRIRGQPIMMIRSVTINSLVSLSLCLYSVSTRVLTIEQLHTCSFVLLTIPSFAAHHIHCCANDHHHQPNLVISRCCVVCLVGWLLVDCAPFVLLRRSPRV